MNTTDLSPKEVLSRRYRSMRSQNSNAPRAHPSPERTVLTLQQCNTPTSDSSGSPWLSPSPNTFPQGRWTAPSSPSSRLLGLGSMGIPRSPNTGQLQSYQKTGHSSLHHLDFEMDWRLFDAPRPHHLNESGDDMNVKVEHSDGGNGPYYIPIPTSAVNTQPYAQDSSYGRHLCFRDQPQALSPYDGYRQAEQSSRNSEPQQLVMMPEPNPATNPNEISRLQSSGVNKANFKTEEDGGSNCGIHDPCSVGESDSFDALINLDGNDRNVAKRRKSTSRVWNCSKCRLRFPLASKLAEHMQTHETPRKKPHRCGINGCNMSFARRAECDRHQNCVHYNRRIHGCECGEKSFARRDSLLRHQCSTGCILRNKGKKKGRKAKPLPPSPAATTDSPSENAHMTGPLIHHGNEANIRRSLHSSPFTTHSPRGGIDPTLLDRQRASQQRRKPSKSTGNETRPEDDSLSLASRTNPFPDPDWDPSELHIT